MDTWETIRIRCRRDGEKIKVVARDLGLAPNTVRKYLRQDGPPKHALKPRAKRLDPPAVILRQIVADRKGKMLGTYLGERIKVLIRCAQGHEWSGVPHHLRKGIFCKRCSHRETAHRLSLNEIRARVARRHGTLLTSTYVNQSQRLSIRCERDHLFEMTAGNVSNGRWCRSCALMRRGKAKRDTHNARTAAIFKVVFAGCATFAARHELSITAFCPLPRRQRHQARFLFTCAFGHSWIVMDSRAVSVCRRCERDFDEKLQAARRVRVARRARERRARSDRMIQIQACRDLFKRGRYAGLHQIASELGGELLSESYQRAHDKMVWRCKRGHEFLASAHSVSQRHWCKRCSTKDVSTDRARRGIQTPNQRTSC